MDYFVNSQKNDSGERDTDNGIVFLRFFCLSDIRRRMTSVIDCVVSYIASAFSFFSLVHIIPSFLSVQDFVRRPVPAKYLSGILFLPYHGVKAEYHRRETEGDYG